MSTFATKSLVGLLATSLLGLAIGGCGGVEARKARHLEKGRTFLSEGNYEKARVEFRNALQIAPTDGEARYENGVVDEKLGNPREAAQFYQGALDVNKDDIRASANLGRLYVFAGAPERALEIIKPALEKHADDAALLTVRAAARVQLHDQEGALKDAEKAVQLAPNDEDAVAVLAGIYKSQKNNEAAETLLTSAIKRIPNTVNLRLVLAELYASGGHDAEVEALLKELMAQNPKEKSHRIRLAQFYARTNRIDDAEQVLRQGIKEQPDQRDFKIALVDFLATRRSREAAESELKGFIAQNPKDYALQFALGGFYEQGKEPAKAAAVYTDVMNAAGFDDSGIIARDRLAALKVQENDIPAAEKLIAEVLAKSPRDNDALILRGNLALAQKDPKAAITDLRSVLRDQPNAVGVMRSLARAHLANGEPALAEETMRRAMEANPKDPGARLDLAQLLMQLGKSGQAEPIINELVQQQPDNVQALDLQFKIGMAAKDPVLAKAAADAIVVLQPKSPLGYYYQGGVAETDKRFDEALRLYTTSLELKPDASEPLEAVTRVLVAQQRAPEALKRLDQEIARNPKLPVAANLKGQVLLFTKRPAEAAEAFKLAIEREPKWWVPYRDLAEAESQVHDDNAGIAVLLDGISKVNDRIPLDDQLAILYERAGKSDDAIGVYEAELRRNPGSDVSANNLAMLLVSYKKDPVSLDRAKELAARFSNSSNEKFLDTYGWVLYKRGEAPAAVAALKSAITKGPESPVSLYHLGMAQALAGESAAARDSLTRSLESGTKFSGMEEARAELDRLAKLNPAPLSPQS